MTTAELQELSGQLYADRQSNLLGENAEKTAFPVIQHCLTSATDLTHTRVVCPLRYQRHERFALLIERPTMSSETLYK